MRVGGLNPAGCVRASCSDLFGWLLSKNTGMRIDIGSKNQSEAVEPTFLFLLLLVSESSVSEALRGYRDFSLDQTVWEGGTFLTEARAVGAM